MIKKIRASFIVKTIFQYLIDERKFKLIIYNKGIKKILNIDILDYKRFSGKYIIYEKDGFAKEFNGHDRHLIYEGEYLNGKRNGKGKEYDDNNELIYVGNYLNGLKWCGTWKEIRNSKDNKKILLTEYKFGLKRDLNMLIYNKHDRLIYEGGHYKGKRHGKGKEYYEHGSLAFDGEYLNDHKMRGKQFFENGKVEFEGEFLFDEKWNGKVYDKYGKLSHEIINGNK